MDYENFYEEEYESDDNYFPKPRSKKSKWPQKYNASSSVSAVKGRTKSFLWQVVIF